jgi:hypothetical protein
MEIKTLNERGTKKIPFLPLNPPGEISKKFFLPAPPGVWGKSGKRIFGFREFIVHPKCKVNHCCPVKKYFNEKILHFILFRSE